MKLQQLSYQLMRTFKYSLFRFPETIIISLGFVVTLIINNRSDYDPLQTLIKLAMIFAIAIPLSIALILLREESEKGYIFRGIADLLLVGGGVTFYWLMPEELNNIFMLRYTFAFLMLCLTFTMIPYWLGKENYSLYLIKLIVIFFTTYMYTLVLYGGLSAIVFAMDSLFVLNINRDIYFDLFIVSVGLFGLSYFLGKMPLFKEDISLYRYPSVLKVLLTHIVMPLICIYTLILHVYLLKVLIDGQWQNQLINYMVLWYGYISITLLITIQPLIEQSQWVRRFSRLYPYGLPVPFTMLMISILLRINDYGLTINRGMVILSLLWFLCVLVYMVVIKIRHYQLLVIGFILIFIIGLFGPVNIVGLTISSQGNRLNDFLVANNMIEDDNIIKGVELSLEDQQRVSSQLNVLEELDAVSYVRGLDEDFKLKDMEKVFGFPYRSDYYVDTRGIKYLNYYYTENESVDISKYQYHRKIQMHERRKDVPLGENYAIIKGEELILVENSTEYLRLNIVEEIKAYENLFYLDGRSDSLLFIKGEGEDILYSIRINEFGIEDKGEELVVNYLEGDIFYKILRE